MTIRSLEYTHRGQWDRYIEMHMVCAVCDGLTVTAGDRILATWIDDVGKISESRTPMSLLERLTEYNRSRGENY